MTPLEDARKLLDAMERRMLDTNCQPDMLTELNECQRIMGCLVDWAESITIVFVGIDETEH